MPTTVRAKKAEVFKAIHPLTPEDAVRGQYAAGDDRRREGRGLSRGAGRRAGLARSKPMSRCA